MMVWMKKKRPPRLRMLSALALLAGLAVAACGKPPAPSAEIRPVRSIVINPQDTTDAYTAPGEIRARYETPIAFRLSGRMLARKVDVGSLVKEGDQIALLDDRDQRNALDAAKSDVFSAQSELAQATAQENRYGELRKNGYASQERYDLALRSKRTSEAKLQSAQANLSAAQDQLAYTVLAAPRSGVITAVGGDAGQVVGAGQMVAQLADPSEREGLFNVAESWLRGPRRTEPTVEVALQGDPSVKTMGLVREISPTADPVTRTYAVRVSLPDAPQAMLLGASIIGLVTVERPDAVAVLPVAALFQKNSEAAVWVVDPASSEVQLKPVTIQRYEADKIVVGQGLSKGDRVVTAGVQKLSPGEKVRIAGDASTATGSGS
jgi:RND family efflux transporter MFP subunit